MNALQDFLESTTSSIGDILMLFGIVAVLLTHRLEARPAHPAGAAGVDRHPRRLPAVSTRRRSDAARDASAIANGALAENIYGVRTVQETRREAMNFELYEEKARENDGDAELRRARPVDDPDRGDPDRPGHGEHHRRRRRGGDRLHAPSSGS